MRRVAPGALTFLLSLGQELTDLKASLTGVAERLAQQANAAGLRILELVEELSKSNIVLGAELERLLDGLEVRGGRGGEEYQ